MTIEEKAKAYDEALEKARRLNVDNMLSNEAIEEIFPEVCESEDERIRKALVKLLTVASEAYLIHSTGIKKESYLDWLEKQKEQKQDEGDFTIYRPLKNGKGEYECIPYSFYGSLTSFSEDKDLIDFLRTCFYTEEECNEWIKQQKEQKPVPFSCGRENGAKWSDEDENALKYIHELLVFGYTEKFMDAQTAHDMRKWVNEHLRPDTFQNGNSHWKPSEEQMKALNALNCHGDLSDVGQQNQLISLYNDLKKLM